MRRYSVPGRRGCNAENATAWGAERRASRSARPFLGGPPKPKPSAMLRPKPRRRELARRANRYDRKCRSIKEPRVSDKNVAPLWHGELSKR
jgi:hypothetical protein